MRTLMQIQKEINTLLDEADQIIEAVSEDNNPRKILALSMLITLRKKVKDQFINIKEYTRR